MREKLLFDFNWKFHLGDVELPLPVRKAPIYYQAKTERAIYGPAAYNYKEEVSTCTEKWETVDLPHDYIITQTPNPNYNNTLGFFQYQNAWYRKHFQLNEEDRDKRITLYFEGIAVHATVYVNGCLMARNFCGYTSFEVDITDLARFGEDNVVAVYVDASEHEGWWYEGAGIYRHVWLIKTAKVSVDLWGVYVNPHKQGDKWQVPVETTIRNDDLQSREVEVTSIILNNSRNVVAKASSKIAVKGKDKAVLQQEMVVENPRLWDIDEPNLYVLETIVAEDGIEIDRVETRFGFRTIEFHPERGFFLNGRSVKIKGVCCHEDYGLTGKAMPDTVKRYRLEKLKQMGANGYRTAHYPHSEVTMDLLDELGFLVMAETRWFESTKEGMEQLQMLIKRDRNRPCVVLWSIGNEEPLHMKEQGKKIAESLVAFVRKLDSSRPVTTALSFNPVDAPVNDVVDVIGINYRLPLVDQTREKHPDKPFVSSENCALGTTRGWYLDDDPGRGYFSAYDHPTGFYVKTREETWRFIMERPWLAGGFQWAGIEHRGETEWPRLCSQSGALDLFLQEKDAFYQNKSHWTDAPMVHILPHWNLKGREGELIDVWVYTNCEELELFQDGKSLGVQKIEKYSHGRWKVQYRPGKLTARGINNGTVVATDTVQTTGSPVALKLRLETPDLRANHEDVAVITCYCVDEEGRFVPDASPLITFETNKLGKILGTGSDVCDHTPVNSPVRKMRAGLCAVAVKVGAEPGVLRVYAHAEGLLSDRLDIQLEECTRRPYA